MPRDIGKHCFWVWILRIFPEYISIETMGGVNITHIQENLQAFGSKRHSGRGNFLSAWAGLSVLSWPPTLASLLPRTSGLNWKFYRFISYKNLGLWALKWATGISAKALADSRLYLRRSGLTVKFQVYCNRYHLYLCRSNLFVLFLIKCLIQTKWIRALNVRCKTIKFLEDNIAEYLSDLGYGNHFLYITSKVWSRKEIIDKMNFIKTKHSCSFKTPPSESKGTDWRKCLQETGLEKT